MGPIGYTRVGGEDDYSPIFIGNYGFAAGYEVVFEAIQHALIKPYSISDVQLSVKHVLRKGVLQEAQGPSVAVECGVLLPGYRAQSGVGVLCTGIVSVRPGPLSLHFNANVALDRGGNLGVEPAVIVEGPLEWPVRPVSELLFSHQLSGGNEATALFGAIWRVRESFSIDAALRAGRVDGASLLELRAGFTVAF